MITSCLLYLRHPSSFVMVNGKYHPMCFLKIQYTAHLIKCGQFIQCIHTGLICGWYAFPCTQAQWKDFRNMYTEQCRVQFQMPLPGVTIAACHFQWLASSPVLPGFPVQLPFGAVSVACTDNTPDNWYLLVMPEGCEFYPPHRTRKIFLLICGLYAQRIE